MKIAIIGGGPSGLTAAIACAKNKNNEVYIYEKNSDVGKKLLLTGNGRCNYWNNNQNITFYHSSSNKLKNIINEENLNKVTSFFEEIGLVPQFKNDYCYPFSNKSSSVKSALISYAKSLGVHFIFNKDIKNIKSGNNKFQIDDISYDKLIIATGSLSYPKTGSTGDGYIFAKQFNHTIIPINPSLVQLKSESKTLKELNGIRCNAIVSLYVNEVFEKKELGELQFTSYGLSGICILNLSRSVKNNISNNNKVSIHINFVPWFKEDNFKDYLDNRFKLFSMKNITELVDSFIDYKLFISLLSYEKIDYNKKWNEFNNIEKDKIVNILTDYIFNISDTLEYDNAQTCSGGVCLDELNPNTFESLLQKNLYFCGEVIDVDGDCGGYNLTFSFLSGLLVGLGVNND